MSSEVIVHPFGDIEVALIEVVRHAIEQECRVRSIVGERRSIPADSYARQRAQYRAATFLNELARNSSKERIRLGVANVDLFVPDLNFVFGEASSRRRVAVFSIARLDPQFYGEHANPKQLSQRCMTEAIHEIGHVFGLGHCNRADCVMWFSNTLAGTDRKGPKLCETCAQRLDCQSKASLPLSSALISHWG
jgi:archaemetzincin